MDTSEKSSTTPNESASISIGIDEEEEKPSGIIAMSFILAIVTVHYLTLDPITTYPYIMGFAFWISYIFILNILYKGFVAGIQTFDTSNNTSQDTVEDMSQYSDSELLSELYVRDYISEDELESSIDISEEKRQQSNSIDLLSEK